MIEKAKSRFALIDADIIRYQVGAVMQEHPFLKGGERIPASVEMIHHHVDLLINRCTEVTGSDNFQLCLTGPGNFRNEIALQQDYKGNRATSEKPYHWQTVSDYLHSNYRDNVITCYGYEADDYMAFHRFRDTPNTEFIICSRDKDLNTVPGWHYRWACGAMQPEQLPYNISVYDANKFFYEQMLTGDNTDNIPGCGRKEEVLWGGELMMRRKGVGKKEAKKLLDGVGVLVDDYGNRYGYDPVTGLTCLGEEYELQFLDTAKIEAGEEVLAEFIDIGEEEPESFYVALKRDGAHTIRDCHNIVVQAYRERFPGEDIEALMLENARLLYMGQRADNMFDWTWMEPYMEVSKNG